MNTFNTLSLNLKFYISTNVPSYRFGEQLSVGLTMMPQTLLTRAIESTLDYFEISMTDYTTCEDVLLRKITGYLSYLSMYW